MGLTKYKEGSLKELWALSFPLMLSSLSIMSMIFADRWLLAHFSVTAHNAAVTATTLGWAFIFGWVSLGNIVEVFVAQYNGAKLYHKLGEPVWQMIWASLCSFAFFWPLSLWGGEWFFNNDSLGMLEKEYFGPMLFFGPFYPLSASLCGFFIGQGKTRLVTTVVIIGNLLNVILDVMFIFGIEGWLSPMGVRGASLATGAATILQVVVLGIAFFSQRYRAFGTLNYRLNFKLLWECVRIGLPNSLFFVCEILAFAVYYMMMKKMGEDYITIVGICQTLLILFSFFGEGLNKATAALVGNFIGAKRIEMIPQVIKSGLKLNLLFLVMMLGSIYLCTPLIIQEFLPTADTHFIERISGSLHTCLLIVVFYLFFDGLRFQFGGVLTAAGDTMFLMLAGSTLVWTMMVLPVYFVVVRGGASVEVSCLLSFAYSVLAAVIYFSRIMQGKWRSIVISENVA